MWNRRKKKRKRIILGSIVLLVGAFVYGYMSGEEPQVIEKIDQHESKPIEAKEDKKNPPKTPTKNNHKSNLLATRELEDSLELNPTEFSNDVSEQTQMIFTTHYTKTGDSKKEVKKVPSILVGKSVEALEEYIKDEYEGWQIKVCNQQRAELYQQSSQIPPDYYIAKEHEGYIAIYQMGKEGKTKLIEQTQIPTFSLSSRDLEYIQQGIVKKEKNEINQLLEDYSS